MFSDWWQRPLPANDYPVDLTPVSTQSRAQQIEHRNRMYASDIEADRWIRGDGKGALGSLGDSWPTNGQNARLNRQLEIDL